MIIKQEIADFLIESNNYGISTQKWIRGVRKYHTSRKGKARLNPWFDYYKKIFNIVLVHHKVFELEVKA